MTLFIPDLSNNNWSSNQDVTNFLSQLIPQGFAGASHKVSEGNYYQDSYWPVFQQYCQGNSIPYIGYHCLTNDDPASQVQTYQANDGTPNMMMDHEQFNGQNPDINQFWAVVNAFNAANINVQLEYLPQWFWQNIGAPDLSALATSNILLVSSAYPGGSGYASVIYDSAGGDSGEGWTPYGGATPNAWQFTDAANIAGINVDCNAYLGTDINVLFGTAAAPVPPVIVPPPSPPSATPPPVSTTGNVTPVSTPAPVAATPPPDNPTVDQVLTYLIQELSASGDTPLTAATNTVSAPDLTLRGAIQAILWITNAAVDMKGTDDATGRPFPPSAPDTILGHILSMRAEGLITQALIADLAAASGRDVTTIIANAKASWS